METLQTRARRSPDAAVVAALVEGRRRFLAFLERRVGDPVAAEEILQSALARALERGGEVRQPERAVAWFYRVLRNAIADHWRLLAAEARGREALAREIETEPPAELEPPSEICRCFEALLPTLPPHQAELIRRVDLGGTPPVEVAREEGISANNAMVRLHRARRALRRRLIETCRTCAEHGCLDCSCSRTGARAPEPL